MMRPSQPSTASPELDYGYVLREAHELHRYYGVGDKHPYTCTVIAGCISTLTSQAARIEELERTVDLLESNARVQAKLLADTGRRAEAMEAALRACRTSYCGFSITKNDQYPEVLASFWKEIQRIDTIASAALQSEKTP